MERLVQIDQAATLWLNTHSPGFLDGVWHFASGTREWFPLYGLVMGFMIWKLGWRKGLVAVLALILGVVLSDQLSVLVKEAVMRLRPCRDPWMISKGIRLPDGPPGGLYGFFSSHASNVFGFASCSWLSLRLNDRKHSYNWYGWCIFIWAAVVSLSRVMVGAHFLGDILAGTVFGILVGTALALAARLLIVKAKV